MAIVCSKYPNPSPPSSSGTVTPNKPISPIFGNTSWNQLALGLPDATNLGHVIRFINLSCSWCDFLLCETFYYLTELISAPPLIGYFETHLLLFRCQTSYSRIITRIRSPQCPRSGGDLLRSAFPIIKGELAYDFDSTEAWPGLG
jgi:hypothetical protein